MAWKKKVRKILRQVKSKGDKAIRKLTAELDGCKLKKFEVTGDEITKSSANVSEALKKAIGVAYANIEKFHQAQREEIKRIETIPGGVQSITSLHPANDAGIPSINTVENNGAEPPGMYNPIFSMPMDLLQH